LGSYQGFLGENPLIGGLENRLDHIKLHPPGLANNLVGSFSFLRGDCLRRLKKMLAHAFIGDRVIEPDKRDCFRLLQAFA
jgi:hypothetical protein